jgi:hypothetical protein
MKAVPGVFEATTGEYLSAVRDGEPVPEPTWEACRLTVTPDQLVVRTEEEERRLPYDRLRVPSDPSAVLPDHRTIEKVAGLTLAIDDSLVVITTADVNLLCWRYHCAALTKRRVWARHKPGTYQGRSVSKPWTKADLEIDKERVAVDFGDTTVTCPFEGVGRVGLTTHEIQGSDRPVIVVRYTNEYSPDNENVLVVTGTRALCRGLRAVFDGPEAADRGVTERRMEFDPDERTVIEALYNGVSPLEVHEQTDLSIAEVEAAYRDLMDKRIVDEIRTRTEVELTQRGLDVADEELDLHAPSRESDIL